MAEEPLPPTAKDASTVVHVAAGEQMRAVAGTVASNDETLGVFLTSGGRKLNPVRPPSWFSSDLLSSGAPGASCGGGEVASVHERSARTLRAASREATVREEKERMLTGLRGDRGSAKF